MPSGRAHESINLSVFAGLASGYAYLRAQGLTVPYDSLLAPQAVALFSASYLVGTFLVTPDLDLAENNVRAKSNWGVLGLLWEPYGSMFSHRGLSHTWILGPLTRLVYMAVVGLAFAWLTSFIAPFFGYQFSIRAQLTENWRSLLLGALLGYYVSQWLHLIADGIWPDHGAKRRKRRRKRKKR